MAGGIRHADGVPGGVDRGAIVYTGHITEHVGRAVAGGGEVRAWGQAGNVGVVEDGGSIIEAYARHVQRGFAARMGAAIDQQLEGQVGDPGVPMHASIVEGASVTRLFVLLRNSTFIGNSNCYQ